MLPKVAFTGFVARYREPKIEEGFQDVTKLDFKASNVRTHSCTTVYSVLTDFNSLKEPKNRRCSGESTGFRDCYLLHSSPTSSEFSLVAAHESYQHLDHG